MAKRVKKPGKPRERYGIGEWYGRLFSSLASDDRRWLANLQRLGKRDRPPMACPFRSTSERDIPCTKEGGVFSLRLYRKDAETNFVSPAPGDLVTTCPYRFLEAGRIFAWIGEELLGDTNPKVVTEIPFLQRSADGETRDVGRIDHVLVHPAPGPMRWCALEMQAVYFSGPSMAKEFSMLRRSRSTRLPFPVAHRRPDFRSSGPKRLMPQLQIKVPTLRRWGKKMAVVVDRSFFNALGDMEAVGDVANCDIAWFVVAYEATEGGAALRPNFVRLTTLERAVEALTGGRPVTLASFEEKIREKLAAGA
jgi:hypothetical protein